MGRRFITRWTARTRHRPPRCMRRQSPFRRL
nr:MAG TPA_asm: hypothetical protein [Caudoviricetes sp.]